jgi:hypothetical protein
VKKIPPHEPEKISALPEDEQLMPENEPENILKIQLRSAFGTSRPFALFAFKTFKNLGHSNVFFQNLRPFTQFRADIRKSPAIHTVPLCSVLFRQKFFPTNNSRRYVPFTNSAFS